MGITNEDRYTTSLGRCVNCGGRVRPTISTDVAPIPTVGEYYVIPSWDGDLYRCVSVSTRTTCGCHYGSTYWQATFVAAKASAGRLVQAHTMHPHVGRAPYMDDPTYPEYVRVWKERHAEQARLRRIEARRARKAKATPKRRLGR